MMLVRNGWRQDLRNDCWRDADRARIRQLAGLSRAFGGEFQESSVPPVSRRLSIPICTHRGDQCTGPRGKDTVTEKCPAPNGSVGSCADFSCFPSWTSCVRFALLHRTAHGLSLRYVVFIETATRNVVDFSGVQKFQCWSQPIRIPFARSSSLPAQTTPPPGQGITSNARPSCWARRWPPSSSTTSQPAAGSAKR